MRTCQICQLETVPAKTGPPTCPSCRDAKKLQKQREYRKTERGRAVNRKFAQSAKAKASAKKYRQSAKGRTTLKIARRRRFEENPEKHRAQWRKLNKTPASRVAQKRYAESKKGRKKRVEVRGRYKRSPKGLASAARSGAKRRANLALVDRTLTSEEWAEIKANHKHRCYYCNRKMKRLTMDHVIPLNKGGKHIKENIVPACQSCNSRKGTNITRLC